MPCQVGRQLFVDAADIGQLLQVGVYLLVARHGQQHVEPPAFGIRQEMVCFHAARRGHKPSSAERGASQVERSVLRPIYPKKQITQPVAGGIRRREFGWLKCQRLSRPCLQGGKMIKHERTKNGAESSQPCF